MELTAIGAKAKSTPKLTVYAGGVLYVNADAHKLLGLDVARVQGQVFYARFLEDKENQLYIELSTERKELSCTITNELGKCCIYCRSVLEHLQIDFQSKDIRTYFLIGSQLEGRSEPTYPLTKHTEPKN